MAGRTGTAVVLDVESGAILAAHRLDLAARRVVFPGSTVKPFVLLALLESKRLSLQDSLLCPIRLRIAENQIDCSHPLRGGAFDPVAALAFSCNNFFAHFAPRLSPANLDAALSRSGMTQPSGLATREATGQIFPSRNRDAHLLKALGKSGVTVTPLGLLAAYRKLALRVQNAPPDEAPL
ncbi:MAG TPA: penicillin-binding transpeptidase domain-containing protein, partial [Candidatus Nitrosotenuis sp.]|nr:penicillin-binding transpeptidase domain-containing protein [Candidatus Nitrosotenuis sp.]